MRKIDVISLISQQTLLLSQIQEGTRIKKRRAAGRSYPGLVGSTS